MKYLPTLLCGALLSPALFAAPVNPELAEQLSTVTTPQELNADHFIGYKQTADAVTLKSATTTVVLNTKTFAMTVARDGAEWALLPPEDATVRLQDGSDLALPLQSARSIEVEVESWAGLRGAKITLSKFRVNGSPIDLKVHLFVGIDWPTGDVVFELRPQETKTALRMAVWPGTVDGSKVEGTVIPHKQGFYVPRNWHRAFDAPYRDMDKFGFAWSHSLYMPWWGFSANGKSAMLVLDTPVDGGCYFRHDPKTGTKISPKWIHSLGRMNYTRRSHLKMLDGNYVQMAKAYRQESIDKGRFRSLKEKIAETPKVAGLIGTPIVHTTAFYNDIKNNASWAIPYTDHVKFMKKLRELGFKNGYFHLDGVGYRGYDNLEPDQLPIGAKAGGPAGLKSLIQELQGNGWLFAYHQQYRDMYLDSPSYNRELLALREDGTHHFETTWAGGKNAVLCSSKALDYVRRNNTFLAQTGLKPDGCYLDVFAIVHADECYHPEHRVSRAECFENRRQCFDYIHSKFGIVSSEEPVDWALRTLHLVHHTVWARDTELFALPIPLYHLVYHDAIVIPGESARKRGSYYVANSEIPFLHALVSANMPYLNEDPTAEDVAAVKILTELHKRTALLQMTDHKLLSEDGRRQQSTYADGTVITADQNSGDWEIRYPEKTVKGNAIQWQFSEKKN